MSVQKPHSVLVAVGSRHGSTAEIGSLIGARLRGGLPATWHVAVEDTEALDTIEGYDAVVLGSAVYLGRWLRSAKRLFDNAQVPPPSGLWLFSSGPVEDGPHEGKVGAAVAKAGRRLQTRDHVVFSGRIVTQSLGPLERLLTSVIHVNSGDFRDWGAIKQWADIIALELSHTSVIDRPIATPIAEES